MRDRFSFGPRDRRNLGIVVAIMTVVLAALTEGPIAVQLVVSLVGGLFSGVVFFVVTVVLNAYKPDYW